jgi:hypothetical protein
MCSAGVSYHAVQEVFTSTKPRMSIQGWYHSDAPPPGADKASLQLLQSSACDEPILSEGEDDEDEEEGISEDDVAFLKRFINPAYIKGSALEAIANKFDEVRIFYVVFKCGMQYSTHESY